jgi:hypothetical protein
VMLTKHTAAALSVANHIQRAARGAWGKDKVREVIMGLLWVCKIALSP